MDVTRALLGKVQVGFMPPRGKSHLIRHAAPPLCYRLFLSRHGISEQAYRDHEANGRGA